jgi:hypothetical protein
MLKNLKYIFQKYNNISKCPKCKNTKQVENNFDLLDGFGSTVLEYDIICDNCGHYLNHYAYGFMEYLETKTGYIKWCFLYGGKPVGVKGYWEAIKESFSILWL